MTLLELRERAGMTQAELADAIGRVQPYIGKIECGITDINNITLGNAYKLAHVLGCQIEDLVDLGKVQ